MKSPVERVVYRALYRLARKFDQNPNSKCLLHRSALAEDSSPIAGYYTSVVENLLGRKVLTLPSQSPSFVEVLRKEARRETTESVQIKTEAGLSLMRKMTSVWKSYKDLVESVDKRDITGTIKRDDIGGPTKGFIPFKERNDVLPGHVLIAHPLLAGALHRSVILVLENSEKGSYGLVINRPTSHTLHPAVVNLPLEMKVSFGSANVAFGGMVRRLQYLHTLPGCGGFEIPFCSQPLYAGGLIKKVLSKVDAQPSLLSEFQFFVGCCCWRPGQLREEIDSGCWVVAETEPDKLVALLQTNTPSDDKNYKRYANGLEVERSVDVYQYAIDSLGDKYRNFTLIPHTVDHTKIEAL